MSPAFIKYLRYFTFSQMCHVEQQSTVHSTRPDKEDVKKVVSIVLRNKLLVEIGHREHRSFQNLKLNPLHKWDVKKSEEWIRGKIRENQKFRGNHYSEVSESEIEWWDIVEYLLEENHTSDFLTYYAKVCSGVNCLS